MCVIPLLAFAACTQANRAGPGYPAATNAAFTGGALVAPGRAALPFVAVRPKAEPTYSDEDILRSFLSIALNAEAADKVERDGTTRISKWREPIRYRLLGARPKDAVQIAALAQHLQQLTGLRIGEARPDEPQNMDIRFVPRQYRGVELAMLAERGWLGPSVGSMASKWRDFEYDRCFALTTRHPSTGVTGTAHVFIKDELSELWRETCIIEEFAQSLGLLNDDPRVRPSIFNDDGEFRTLTSLDELMLRILYDPRIRSGMTRREVTPIARQIIREMRGGGGTRT